MNKSKLPVVIWLVFVSVAVVLAYVSKNIFYFLNFLYIGSFVAVGIYLVNKKWKYARLIVQLGVGLYMLVYLGLLMRENMQLSGFFYYLFLGVFEAATIHYVVAKIFGPLIFGRGWCGYACWTAMVLDLFPFKQPHTYERRKNLGLLRYFIFIITLLFVASLFYFKVQNLERVMFYTFIIGNIIYYVVGIFLAYTFKDNRAFCKYFCPITTFLKPMSYFSILRIKKNDKKCIDCKKCLKVCPMDVDMLDNSRKRKNGTECILCGECKKNCPVDAINMR